MPTKDEIVGLARETIGTPWGHQARLNDVAMDCVGVPVYVAKSIGMEVEDIINYGRVPEPAVMKEAIDKHLVRVSKAEMQAGDVVWIKFTAEPTHLGIIADYPYGGFSLIHSSNMSGLNRVVEHRVDVEWDQRIVAVWRFPNVA